MELGFFSFFDQRSHSGIAHLTDHRLRELAEIRLRGKLRRCCQTSNDLPAPNTGLPKVRTSPVDLLGTVFRNALFLEMPCQPQIEMSALWRERYGSGSDGLLAL